MNIGIISAQRKKFLPEAISYFTSAGITNESRKKYINDNLFKPLKENNLLSEIYGLYLYIGGSASIDKYNLVDPRDLDAAYRLNFQGGWTHTATGATPNGSTGYANTFFVPATVVPTGLMGMGTYNATSTTEAAKVDMGALSSTNRYVQIYAHFFGRFYAQINSNTVDDYVVNSGSNGWFFACRTGATDNYLQKNSTQTDKSSPMAAPTVSIYTGAQNNSGSADFHCDRKKVIDIITKSISKPQGLTLHTIIQAFVNGLSSSPVVNAGSDQIITQPTSGVTLSGSATDSDGTIASYLWTKESGPSCTITSPASASTTITGMSTTGVYVFKLTATDNSGFTGNDTVSITVQGSSGGQTLTTVNSWNAYVHLPSDYDANPTTYYPTIIFFPGLGEVGTDASKLLQAGPSAYIEQGWNGDVTVSGDTTKFIVISLQPPSAYPSEAAMQTRITTLKSTYRIDTAKMNLVGLSHGGWCIGTFVTGDAYGGPFTYASQVNSVVNVQGVVPSDNSPYPNLFDNFADVGGRFLGFIQVNDSTGDNIDTIVNRMNARVSNSGIAIDTNFGTGGHGYWDEYFGGNGKTPENFIIDGVSQNVYQWMAQQ